MQGSLGYALEAGDPGLGAIADLPCERSLKRSQDHLVLPWMGLATWIWECAGASALFWPMPEAEQMPFLQLPGRRMNISKSLGAAYCYSPLITW